MRTKQIEVGKKYRCRFTKNPRLSQIPVTIFGIGYLRTSYVYGEGRRMHVPTSNGDVVRDGTTEKMSMYCATYMLEEDGDHYVKVWLGRSEGANHTVRAFRSNSILMPWCFWEGKLSAEQKEAQEKEATRKNEDRKLTALLSDYGQEEWKDGGYGQELVISPSPSAGTLLAELIRLGVQTRIVVKREALLAVAEKYHREV